MVLTDPAFGLAIMEASRIACVGNGLTAWARAQVAPCQLPRCGSPGHTFPGHLDPDEGDQGGQHHQERGHSAQPVRPTSVANSGVLR